MEKKWAKLLNIAGVIFLFFLLFLVVQIKENEPIKKENNDLPENTSNNQNIERTDTLFKEAEDVKPKEYIVENYPLGKEYFGKWKRINLSINGVQENFSPAILELTDGFFTKTTDCIVSGKLFIIDNKMIMRTEEDGCNEGKNDFVSYYEISSDKNNLILSIKDPQFMLVEKYERILTPAQ